MKRNVVVVAVAVVFVVVEWWHVKVNLSRTLMLMSLGLLLMKQQCQRGNWKI